MVLKNIFSYLIVFLLFISNIYAANDNYLEYKIEGTGEINAEVYINFSNDTLWGNNFNGNEYSPCYILLPFNVEDKNQLQIREDLIYTLKSINNKYTLIATFLEKDIKELKFTVLNPTRPLLTSEGKPKIYVDFRYSDLPNSLKDQLEKSYFYNTFDIKIRTQRRFNDDELSQNPNIPFKRVNDNEYVLEKNRIKNNESWFVYPNLQSEIEKKFLFVLLILFGILTALFQYFPIKERNRKFFKVGLIISAVILLVIFILWIFLPSYIFKTLFYYTGPIFPHILMILIGFFFLKYSEKYLVKIYGTVKDDEKGIQSAQIFLYQQDSDMDKDKPIKELVELNNGNFSFSFIEKKKKKYKIKISKHKYEAVLIENIEIKDKVSELEKPIVLKKVSA